jgi:thiamine pyrophosphate-dependent acetolactate synthase large subunit-like protein
VISELAARLGERALVTMHAGANRLYAVCGDDGFAMTTSTRLTAAQYRIPVTTVVLTYRVLGWVKDSQWRGGNRVIASELGKLDYARMAKSIGSRGSSHST